MVQIVMTITHQRLVRSFSSRTRAVQVKTWPSWNDVETNPKWTVKGSIYNICLHFVSRGEDIIIAKPTAYNLIYNTNNDTRKIYSTHADL